VAVSPPPPPGRRPVGDVLILILAITVCSVIVVSVGTIAVIEILDPKTDTSSGGQIVANVINTLIGLIAGFLAGRTGRSSGKGGE
jgi:hypothetical protein